MKPLIKNLNQEKENLKEKENLTLIEKLTTMVASLPNYSHLTKEDHRQIAESLLDLSYSYYSIFQTQYCNGN
ncbi:hypothetical protein I5M27_08770 [Adhaeribacter sp. BT258]|uniref:Bacteriocin immunity protein n=1 Tax=Adhaeribacter terrigena TaxID=2793070 RepID=A0ABS1C0Z4_9BACT|nr:hypothetical protein [Adhaeribacter terrigena]MBK0403078.1 hypothetical protein [Adhaeribacter terrigena]